jgi:regulator of RNase E activity RraB
MEQKCSHKVISLHLQECSGYCPNASSCYHIKKEINTEENLDEDKIRLDAIKTGHEVHESICFYGPHHKDLLQIYKNYNITLSAMVVKLYFKELYPFKEQIQVTVYDDADIYLFSEWQKLFLINDEKNLRLFDEFLGRSTSRLHFLLDQEFITPARIVFLYEEFEKRASDGQTLDSCLTSWLVNGECPYEDGQYLDITYDASLRLCPYAKRGVMGNLDKNIVEQFEINPHKEKCKYMDIWRKTK